MCDNPPAPLPTFGAQVDDVVGRLDDVQVVLDDDDGVPLVDELVEHVEELVGIFEMEAGRRLIQNVERPARTTARQFLGQFYTLGLPPLSVVADCPSSM